MKNLPIVNPAQELVDVQLQSGKVVAFTIPTSSMAPFLLPGDRVLVRSTDVANLQIGSIVVLKNSFDNGNQPIWFAHRLIAKKIESQSVWLITKGDNSRMADEPISMERVAGILIGIERNATRKRVDLLSRRARVTCQVLAWLSLLQWYGVKNSSGWIRRIVASVTRMTNYGFAFALRGWVG